jgi:hypothetical protein
MKWFVSLKLLLSKWKYTTDQGLGGMDDAGCSGAHLQSQLLKRQKIGGL